MTHTGKALVGCLLAVQVGCTSCSNWAQTEQTIKDVVIDCGGQAVQSSVGELLPIVLAILTGDALDWRKMLVGLVTEFGRDAVACALDKADTTLQSRTARAPEARKGVDRSNTFMSEQRWRIAK